MREAGNSLLVDQGWCCSFTENKVSAYTGSRAGLARPSARRGREPMSIFWGSLSSDTPSQVTLRWRNSSEPDHRSKNLLEVKAVFLNQLTFLAT